MKNLIIAVFKLNKQKQRHCGRIEKHYTQLIYFREEGIPNKSIAATDSSG